MKKVLITGITRQGVPYLAKMLLDKCYDVYGMLCSGFSFISEWFQSFFQHYNEKNYVYSVWFDYIEFEDRKRYFSKKMIIYALNEV